MKYLKAAVEWAKEVNEIVVDHLADGLSWLGARRWAVALVAVNFAVAGLFIATHPKPKGPQIIASGGMGGFAAPLTTPSQLRYNANVTGSVSRPIASKLADQVSPHDFGADCNGSTDDSTGLALMAAANSTNGMAMTFACPIKNLYGIYYPAFGAMSHHDSATIGTNEQLTNTTFTGSPATGWTLANFTSANPTLTHTAGTVGTASQSFTFLPSNNYIVTLTLTTTAAGTVDFQMGGNEITETPYSLPIQGSTTYKFALYNTSLSGSQSFSIITDTAWAGTVTSASVILVQQEFQSQYMSMSKDDTLFRDPMGLKFGRFNAGIISLGDRQTGAFGSTNATWNIAIGARALASNVDGFENTCVGTFACEFNNTNRLTALGYSALKVDSLGIQNTGLGYKAGSNITTASNNTAVGFHSLLQQTTGDNNTGVGVQSLYSQLTDTYNTCVGYQCGLNARGGSENAFFGALAGELNASASNLYNYSFTTSIGAEAKSYGSNSTAVGFQARTGADGAPNTHSTAIGDGAVSAFDSCTSLGTGASCSAVNEVSLGSTTSYVAAQRFALRSAAKCDSTGTPGNATCNLQEGRSTITNATSTVTITNNLVAAGSLVWVTLNTVDGTCTFVKAAVPGSGSFVVTVNANCTGNTNFSWRVD